MEDQDGEIGIYLPENYELVGNFGRPKLEGGGGGEAVSAVARKSSINYRYRECLKNHTAVIGGHAVDGCGEFMAAGEEGTLDALKCAACNCHPNFHRKETEGESFHPSPQHLLPYYGRTSPPSPHPRPLALPSTSREDQT